MILLANAYLLCGDAFKCVSLPLEPVRIKLKTNTDRKEMESVLLAMQRTFLIRLHKSVQTEALLYKLYNVVYPTCYS